MAQGLRAVCSLPSDHFQALVFMKFYESADPGRRKGERARNKTFDPCRTTNTTTTLPYYYYYDYDYDYGYDYEFRKRCLAVGFSPWRLLFRNRSLGACCGAVARKRVPSFRATVFPYPAACVFSFGGRAAAATTGAAGGFYVSLCLIVQTAVQKWSKTIVFLGFQKGR